MNGENESGNFRRAFTAEIVIQGSGASAGEGKLSRLYKKAEYKFSFIHGADKGLIGFKRYCKKCGQDVNYDDLKRVFLLDAEKNDASEKISASAYIEVSPEQYEKFRYFDSSIYLIGILAGKFEPINEPYLLVPKIAYKKKSDKSKGARNIQFFSNLHALIGSLGADRKLLFYYKGRYAVASHTHGAGIIILPLYYFAELNITAPCPSSLPSANEEAVKNLCAGLVELSYSTLADTRGAEMQKLLTPKKVEVAELAEKTELSPISGGKIENKVENEVKNTEVESDER